MAAMQESRYVAVIAVLSVLVLALALNPSAEQHRARIKATIAERSPIAGALGIGSLTAFTSTYHSLGVASYTTANDKTVSVGAFGVVVVTQ
jgi:hypothetical protein